MKIKNVTFFCTKIEIYLELERNLISEMALSTEREGPCCHAFEATEKEEERGREKVLLLFRQLSPSSNGTTWKASHETPRKKVPQTPAHLVHSSGEILPKCI